jgi:hypothetical protein
MFMLSPIDGLYVSAWRSQMSAEENRSVAFTPFGCFLWDNGGLTVYGYDADGQIHDLTPEEKRDRVEQLKKTVSGLAAHLPKRPLLVPRVAAANRSIPVACNKAPLREGK